LKGATSGTALAVDLIEKIVEDRPLVIDHALNYDWHDVMADIGSMWTVAFVKRECVDDESLLALGEFVEWAHFDESDGDAEFAIKLVTPTTTSNAKQKAVADYSNFIWQENIGYFCGKHLEPPLVQLYHDWLDRNDGGAYDTWTLGGRILLGTLGCENYKRHIESNPTGKPTIFQVQTTTGYFFAIDIIDGTGTSCHFDHRCTLLS
jgi:hypothetical protein